MYFTEPANRIKQVSRREHSILGESTGSGRVASQGVPSAPAASFRLDKTDQVLHLVFIGDWSIEGEAPPFQAIERELVSRKPASARLILHGERLTHWDSLLLSRILQCFRWCKTNDYTLHLEKMPAGVGNLLDIATAVEPFETRKSRHRVSLVQWWRTRLTNYRNFGAFIGSLSLAIFALCRGRSNTRRKDFLHFADQAGPRALAIVTLISVLVGMILAYMGALQLRQFGAQVYVADLVAIGMTREMSALMTGIIMAGRTGAAYAAQLGTMQTNEEIDAIETLGMSPMEFLVTPRVLALIMIMPLLCIYSDILGILGGGLVAMGMDVSWVQYIIKVKSSIDWGDIGAGLIKSVIFATLIAIAGCQAGLRCGRSSAAVGQATTSAVVKGIVYIVVADALLNIVYDKVGL